METILSIRLHFLSTLMSEKKNAIFWGVFEKFVERTNINIRMVNIHFGLLYDWEENFSGWMSDTTYNENTYPNGAKTNAKNVAIKFGKSFSTRQQTSVNVSTNNSPQWKRIAAHQHTENSYDKSDHNP